MTVTTPPSGGSWLHDLGLELTEVTGTRVVGHIDLGPQHHTPWGVIHGGVYAAIVESVGSIGASVAVGDRGQFAVGVHNATDFIRSMSDGRVEVVGTPVQQGRVQQLWDVAITRAADGKLVAQGRLRLQNLPRPTPVAEGLEGGRITDMTAPDYDDRTEQRADDILPEERAAGGDPEAQAAAILADSDARSVEREGSEAAGSDRFEHRRSDETVEP